MLNMEYVAVFAYSSECAPSMFVRVIRVIRVVRGSGFHEPTTKHPNPTNENRVLTMLSISPLLTRGLLHVRPAPQAWFAWAGARKLG